MYATKNWLVKWFRERTRRTPVIIINLITNCYRKQIYDDHLVEPHFDVTFFVLQSQKSRSNEDWKGSAVQLFLRGAL